MSSTNSDEVKKFMEKTKGIIYSTVIRPMLCMDEKRGKWTQEKEISGGMEKKSHGENLWWGEGDIGEVNQ